MSIPLALATILGVIILLMGAYFGLVFPMLSPDLAVVLILLSVFVTMPSWQYFLCLKSHYYVTDQRVGIAGSGHASHELGLDNIEHISKYEGLPFGSWHIQFVAADGSDIDGSFDGKTLLRSMGFHYLWRSEAKRVEQLVKDRLLPIREPRIYRCGGCAFQGKSKEELLLHIGTDHGGSVT